MTATDRITFVAGLIVLGVSAAMGFGDVFDPLTVPGYDLAAYLAAADRLLAGRPLYEYDPNSFGLGPYGQFLYPPPIALAFVPLAFLPISVAIVLWVLLLEVIAVAVAIDIARSVVPAHLPWVLASFLYFPPLLWDVNLGNTATLTLALCWATWRLRARPRVAGVLLAAAVGVKLLPLLLVPFFAAAGRVRLLFWAGLTLLAVAVVSWPVVGSAWGEYLGLLWVDRRIGSCLRPERASRGGRHAARPAPAARSSDGPWSGCRPGGEAHAQGGDARVRDRARSRAAAFGDGLVPILDAGSAAVRSRGCRRSRCSRLKTDHTSRRGGQAVHLVTHLFPAVP